MTTDADMKIDYRVVLRDLEEQLAGIDTRRRALEAAIEAVKVLIGPDDPQTRIFDSIEVGTGRLTWTGGHKPKPTIPPGFFAGKTPTQAYRDLMRVWPGEYSPPQMADAFLAGGMKSRTRTALVQSIHSVLKRERRRNPDAGSANGRPSASGLPSSQ